MTGPAQSGAAADGSSKSETANGAAANGSSKSEMVFRCWGPDTLGLVEVLMKVVMDHEAEVRDIGQFLLEGNLMLALALRVSDRKAMALMRELARRAKEHRLQTDFHFPESGEDIACGVQSKVAVLSIVTPREITPALLCEVDKVLCENKCVVDQIDHRSDNKRENNGEYNKVEIRMICPYGLKLSTLSIGPPTAEGGKASRGLQEVLWDHGAEMTIRWWNALNRPNGKSLVVFGLSNELCPYDILDEVLREAGLDPGAAEGAEGADIVDKKVSLLAGVRPEVIDRVVERMEFTKGAKLVCEFLKRMGFRLAILTNHAIRKAADRAKRALGFDYVISRELEVVDGVYTGKYTGDLSDVRFRKEDLLKLMADREGIEYSNVIVVGEHLTGLNASSARRVIETFGQNVYFRADKNKDLTMTLYLLGFNGSDMRALRRRRSASCAELEDPASEAAPPAKRFKVQVSARSRDPGQISRIFAPLGAQQVHISTVRQYSLQDGGMCLGMALRVQKGEPEAVLKELLLACQKEGFQVRNLDGDSAQEAVRLDGDSDTRFTLKTPEQCWKHYSRDRHVVTLVQKPTITAASFHGIFGLLREFSMNIIRMDRLSAQEMAAIQFTVDVQGLEEARFSKASVELSRALGVDLSFQKDDLDRWMRRLVVFDMDSTLIQQEVIDELARIAGVETEVKALTEAAMSGELNFFDSLKSRVALLKGHSAAKLFEEVKANLIFTPGAKKLCSTLRRLGFKTAVISGGFLPVAQEVQRQLGLDYAFANTLEVDETTGLLTGRTQGPVVTPQRKRALLATIANIEGCEVKQTIAVGDGANDIPMLHAAGLGIAFCAKPKVQEASQFRINQKDLSTVLFLIGVSEHAVEHLSLPEVGQVNEADVP